MAVRGTSTTSAALVAFVLVALVLAGPLGCLFDDEGAPGAVLLCARDADCGDDICDLTQHVCVPPGTDLRPPRIDDVKLVPAFSRGGIVELRIRADQNLSADGPQQAFFTDEGAPVPGAAQVDGVNATFFLNVDEVAEGAYALARVQVTDVEGASATREVAGVVLVVDRSPPVLRNAAFVEPPPGDVYADLPPHNTVEVTALPSEPVADVSMHLGALGTGPGDCVVDGVVRCTLTIPPGGLPDGDAVVDVLARDDAGNEGEATLGLHVDAAPPVVVPDSVTVSIETLGRPAEAARADSKVLVSLVTDEILGADPVLAFDVDGARLPLALVERQGRRATFLFDASRPEMEPLLPGTYGLRVSLVDAFGHRRDDAPLALPAPYAAGVPFVADGAICPTPPALGCGDLDGDGAASSACGGSDEDDLDPNSFVGMREIPGDGADNDFIGGDAPIDETVGVFVDSEAGDDANAGTRAAPLRTIDVARQRAAPNLFLAARDTPYVSSGDANRKGLVGGLDPATWEPTSGRSIVGAVSNAPFIVGLESESVRRTNGADTMFIARSAIGTLAVERGSARVTDSTVTSASLLGSGFTCVGSQVAGMIPDNHGIGLSVRLSGCRTGFMFVGNESVLIAANSALAGATCSGCRQMSFFHSSVSARITFAASATQPSTLELVGVNAVSATSPVVEITTQASASVTLVANNFFASSLGPRVIVDGVEQSVDELNACAFARCARAEGNVDVAVPPATALGPDSPLRDRVVPVLPFMPASVVGDIDGDCRYDDGASDIGADEVR